MSITMSQLATRYAQAATKVDNVSSKQLARFAQVGVGYVKRSIQDYHAVDTGAMLNSTTVETQGKSTYLIGPTVKYAPYIALGTSRMPARPFHIKSAQQLRSKIGDLGIDVKALGL